MNLKKKLALCYRILRQEPGNLMAHANREMPPDGADSDGMQALMNQQIREMILLFGTHGHSGFSASHAIGLLKKLLAYEPLGHLTGDDSEWNECSDGVFQNNRCSHVFKQADRHNGQAYDINGIVFWEWYTNDEGEISKSHFTSGDSHIPITFPYTPAKEYRERVAEVVPSRGLSV